jgi:type I restriction enzyme S subunit
VDTNDGQEHEGWTTATIEALAEPKGIAYGVLKPGPLSPSGVPMLRVTDVRDGEIHESDVYRISSSLDAEYRRTKLRGGEILVSIQGTVGRVAIVPKGLAGSNISRTLAMIRLRDADLAPWVRRALESPQLQQTMRDAVTGTTRDSLNLRDLRQIQIPIAPRSERVRILDTLVEVDRLSSAATTHLAFGRNLVERFRQAVLTAACSGRLTADWRDAHDLPSAHRIAELLQLRRANWRGSKASSSEARYREPLPPFAWSAELPPTWTVASLSQAAYLDVGHAFASKDFSTHGIRLLRGENSAPGRLKWKDVKYWPHNKLGPFQHLMMQADDLVLGMDRPIISTGLKLARVTATDIPSLLVQRVLRIRAVEPASTGFIEFCMRDGRFGSYLQGGGMTGSDLPHITGTGVAEFPIPWPTSEERAEIVRRVNELFGLTDLISTRIDSASGAVEVSGRAVLAMAFGGVATAPAQR